MPIKCSWLFNGTNWSDEDNMNFGFSESWYFGGSEAGALDAMEGVSIVRRQIMAFGCAIVGYRLSDGAGLNRLVRKYIPTAHGVDYPNLPVDAALCQCRVAGTPTIKKFWLHNLPDDWVSKAAIVATRKNQIRTVIDAYSAFGFQVRYSVLNAPTVEVLSITDQGVVTCLGAHQAAANNKVTLLRCRDVNGRPQRGVYVVSAVANATTLTLAHWPGNVVARSGKIRMQQFAYGTAVSLGEAGLIRGGSRKVGRPFFLLRGRAPARH